MAADNVPSGVIDVVKRHEEETATTGIRSA